MSVTLSLQGTAELSRALDNMSDDIKAAVSKAVIGTAMELRTDIIKRYNEGGKSGITYQKYNPRRLHTASAPGQAPATDTGRLAGSVYWEQNGQLTATVGSNLAYAPMLEFRTSRVLPRPAWVPAVEKMRPKFIARLERAIGGATR